MLLRRLLPVLLALSLAAPAMAAQDFYYCKLKVPRIQSWVPDQIVVVHDTDKGTVLVNDPIIDFFMGKPVNARITGETATRLSFTWRMTVLRNRDKVNGTDFDYRATLTKATDAIRIVAKPRGYDNDFNAEGKCQLRPPA